MGTKRPKQHDVQARQEAAEEVPPEGIVGKEEALGQEAGNFMREDQSPQDIDAGIDAAGKDAQIRSSPRKTEPLKQFRSDQAAKPKGRGER